MTSKENEAVKGES